MGVEDPFTLPKLRGRQPGLNSREELPVEDKVGYAFEPAGRGGGCQPTRRVIVKFF